MSNVIPFKPARVVTIAEGHDPDTNPMWTLKINGEYVAEVFAWEASGYDHPATPCASFTLAEYLAEALRSYTGPLEERK
jgi:hypothetical protein